MEDLDFKLGSQEGEVLASLLQIFRDRHLRNQWWESTGVMEFLCLGWVSRKSKIWKSQDLGYQSTSPHPFRNTEVSLSLCVADRIGNRSCLLLSQSRRKSSQGVLGTGQEHPHWGLSFLSASNWWKGSTVQEVLHCKSSGSVSPAPSNPLLLRGFAFCICLSWCLSLHKKQSHNPVDQRVWGLLTDFLVSEVRAHFQTQGILGNKKGYKYESQG